MQMFEDITTVVSILPIEVKEVKPALYPGIFIIPPGSFKKPSILHVGTAKFFVPLLADHTLAIDNTSVQNARALITDFIDSQLNIDTDQRPGLGMLQGKVSVAEVMTKHTDLLLELRRVQDNWYKALVQLARADWDKYQRPQFISNIQRIAAAELGLQDEPWLANAIQRQEQCPVCRTVVIPDAIVCSTCRAVLNPEKYKDLQFA